MLVDELKQHKEKVLSEFRDAMEFKAFTDLAYMFAKEFSGLPENNRRLFLGHSQYASEVGMVDQEVNINDLPDYFDNAKENYFFSLIHQQQIALFEHLFFDLIKIFLLDRPERLSKKKQIDYGSIFEVSSKEELIAKLVDRELNEIKYKNVTEWFDYLDKLVGLPEFTKEELDKLAEAKACRDILVHNAGVANQIYIHKSGEAARFNEGQKMDVSGDYTRDTWSLLIEMLVKIIDPAIEKFERVGA